MSATEQAATGGVNLPSHIFTFEGRLVNGDLHTHEIDELQQYAESEHFDLEAGCHNRYGYGSDWLSREQYREIMQTIVNRRVERLESREKHYHRCLDCGRSQMCFDEWCKEFEEDECRVCKERVNRFIQRIPTF